MRIHWLARACLFAALLFSSSAHAATVSLNYSLDLSPCIVPIGLPPGFCIVREPIPAVTVFVGDVVDLTVTFPSQRIVMSEETLGVDIFRPWLRTTRADGGAEGFFTINTATMTLFDLVGTLEAPLFRATETSGETHLGPSYDGLFLEEDSSISFSGCNVRYTVSALPANPNIYTSIHFQVVADDVSIVSAPEVAIDIKPDSDPNSINPFSRGVIPVAILGAEDLDVLDVDPDTLAFGPDAAALAHRNGPHYADVDDDGFIDLLGHFRTQETGIAVGDTEACLTGELVDATAFEACDDIVTVGRGCGLGFEVAIL